MEFEFVINLQTGKDLAPFAAIAHGRFWH